MRNYKCTHPQLGVHECRAIHAWAAQQQAAKHWACFVGDVMTATNDPLPQQYQEKTGLVQAIG